MIDRVAVSLVFLPQSLARLHGHLFARLVDWQNVSSQTGDTTVDISHQCHLGPRAPRRWTQFRFVYHNYQACSTRIFIKSVYALSQVEQLLVSPVPLCVGRHFFRSQWQPAFLHLPSLHFSCLRSAIWRGERKCHSAKGRLLTNLWCDSRNLLTSLQQPMFARHDWTELNLVN